jgi:hypothetical protein
LLKKLLKGLRKFILEKVFFKHYKYYVLGFIGGVILCRTQRCKPPNHNFHHGNFIPFNCGLHFFSKAIKTNTYKYLKRLKKGIVLFWWYLNCFDDSRLVPKGKRNGKTCFRKDWWVGCYLFYKFDARQVIFNYTYKKLVQYAIRLG